MNGHELLKFFQRGIRILKYANLMIVFLLVAGIVLTGCGPAQEQPAQQSEAPPAAQPAPSSESTAPAGDAMELLETRQSATQDTITIVGQVKNTYPREVSGVTVFCDFQDETGKSIRTEQGTLRTDPLPAGQVSEFRISTRYEPSIRRFNVTFAEMFGGRLVTKDSRK
ncbi:MAG: hypothetical protein HY648_11955 [Acidobacteria bacterium]|nr:hypothetical protein [Acidobacteriota bacterium]